MRIGLTAALAFLAALSAGPVLPAAPPSDLDRLMARVLARRDENWKKLQQYVLEERESFDLRGPGGARLYGVRRDYSWFMRDGIFVRSPVRADGVTLPEAQRARAEASWIRREKRRAERRKQAEEATETAGDSDAPPDTGGDQAAALSEASAARLAAEPAFVSWAYFLRFKFEQGQYALVGRDVLDARTVLRIEYYPTALFREGRTRPNRRLRDRDQEIEEKMNKVSLVTLWVDPDAHQIVQYTFDDIDMDFLPGRTLARVDDVRATMRMGQPFPGVWLPREIDMRFGMMLAAGAVDARYRVEYHDYRQADVTYRVR